MSTKPKARKFRIRRATPIGGEARPDGPGADRGAEAGATAPAGSARGAAQGGGATAARTGETADQPAATPPHTAPTQTAATHSAPAQTAQAQTAPAQTAPARTAPAHTGAPRAPASRPAAPGTATPRPAAATTPGGPAPRAANAPDATRPAAQPARTAPAQPAAASAAQPAGRAPLRSVSGSAGQPAASGAAASTAASTAASNTAAPNTAASNSTAAPTRAAAPGTTAAASAGAGADPRPEVRTTEQVDAPPAAEGEVASPREVRADQDIDAIRKEGLTGRQLRMARRVAQKHGLAPTSDFDAVRQLRQRGIDPFERSNMLQLVVPDRQNGDGVKLPQTVPAEKVPQLPSTEVTPAERRANEIRRLQRDLASRRRKRGLLLLTRLAAFVFAPTLLAGWYFFVVATPMYAAKSEFLILQAENQGGMGIGSLLQGTQFATNQDAIAVQSYLESKDAMLRLDRDLGFKSHFQQEWIDSIQRLDSDASIEDTYKIYSRYVKLGYDPTEGVIRMEVSSADPELSARFSENLIEYAEERVDELSRRKREDGMVTARESLERAKAERRAAQEELVRLQEGTFVDPEGIIAGLRGQINGVEIQLQEKELELAALMDNARPNSARVAGAQGDVDRLRTLLAELNRKMTEATTGESSLAEKAARIQMAQADLATADLFLQSALQNEKQMELEANRQVRYLTTSVRPVAPEDPSYPKAFEDTLLAFLIFSGIYLMISLTASILREQVSS